MSIDPMLPDTSFDRRTQFAIAGHDEMNAARVLENSRSDVDKISWCLFWLEASDHTHDELVLRDAPLCQLRSP